MKQKAGFIMTSVPSSQGKSTVKEVPVVHDKGNIYQENKFRGYNNYQPSTITAVDKFTVQPMQRQQPKPKVKLKRAALVQGFIMAQVLDKPRSLKTLWYGRKSINPDLGWRCFTMLENLDLSKKFQKKISTKSWMI